LGIKEAISSAIKEMILPELSAIKNENKEIKTILEMTNKRLDDVNLHLADQSRRIDEARDFLIARIDEVNSSLIARIDEVNSSLIARIDETNNRINRLYEVIVKKEEHDKLEWRIMKLEDELSSLKEKITP